MWLSLLSFGRFPRVYSTTIMLGLNRVHALKLTVYYFYLDMRILADVQSFSESLRIISSTSDDYILKY